MSANLCIRLVGGGLAGITADVSSRSCKDTPCSPEARSRKFREKHPEVATHGDQVLFRSSIIPWWVWIKHSHFPEAKVELQWWDFSGPMLWIL
ncbi:light-harvesting complex 3 isotype 1, chloroplastic [Olea europaea subsp. europaea]|uniref:Light-harvesting complex 3 isotype 1, chloroplastic n=1 Tax=Olea europaea subsp. europaea TaxID=158383 RepID=A0A8S0PZT4_OLEEU|nr:light-harvesting complex 3 isotype 1, chloroplastic [Olea europaea subsp. europaea]